MSVFDKVIREVKPFQDHFTDCKECSWDDDGDEQIDYQLCEIGQKLFDDISDENYKWITLTLL
jgi:hypothetical protein